MKQTDIARVRELLERIARAGAAEDRSDELNAAQRGALLYLARANRFSRAPSHLADYMCTTRGTASQTLKALDRKGFVAKSTAPGDRRSIAYEVTDKGRAALTEPSVLDTAISKLTGREGRQLLDALEGITRRTMHYGGFRSFGICRTCRYHQRTGNGMACQLLGVPLSEPAANEICHEHEQATATA